MIKIAENLTRFAENLARNHPLLNFWNILNITKIFLIINNPIKFIFYLINPKNYLLIGIKTPIGKIRIELRNRENARIFYSIFIREDYKLKNIRQNYIDLGSNIGIAALYFLSRNKYNKIICIEPDLNNINLLIKNLNQDKFKNRYKILEKGIDNKNGYQNLLIAEDGVYSSFDRRKNTIDKISRVVEVITFDELMKHSSFFDERLPIVLKIDIEGIEERVLRSINFNKYNLIKIIILEKDEIRMNRKGYENIIQKNITLKFQRFFIAVIKIIN